MSVAPGGQLRVPTEVLITHVVPADEAEQAIHHHDLAVVAEVHLEAVEPAAAGGEGANIHAAVSKGLAVGGG
ncbi:hypothetical protein D9M71_333240 [compost metagenome]